MNKFNLKMQKAFKQAMADGSKYRYIVFHGGRGGGKTFEVAKSLVYKTFTTNKIFLCGREYQKGIEDSVHQTLVKTIERENLSNHFDVKKNAITNKVTGAKFKFRGLKLNIEGIKSIANICCLWIEEAETISAETWQTIKPTIREDFSQIYITFNPKRKDSVIYNDFVVNDPPPRSYVRKVNYTDNKYFPDVLEEERQHDLTKDYDLYRHIWLGETLTISDAQVFKNCFSVKSFEVDDSYGAPIYGIDFGFAKDPSTAVEVYIKDNCLYIYREAYKVGLELDYTAQYFINHMPLIKTHSSIADSARPESISYLKRHGLPRIKGAKKGKGSVEDGISFIKSFDHVYIHDMCSKAAEEFSLYSYKVDSRTDEILPVLIDSDNHCFSGDTEVIVDNKLMKFEDIPNKGVVRGFNGRNVPYYNGGFIRCDKICNVITDYGIIKCTKDHKFITIYGEWVEAKDLKGKKICVSSIFQNHSKSLMVRDTTNTKMKGISLNILLSYIELFGNTIMEMCLMVFMSIIKTTTRSIIKSKILKLLKVNSICRFICDKDTKITLTLPRNKSKETKINAENGILAKKVKNGIKNITKRINTSFMKKNLNHANNVVSNASYLKGRATYSVPTSANLNGEEKVDLMMSKKNVSYVAKNLYQTNTAKHYAVVSDVETSSNTKEKTYCLTVPNNECFSLANGIVVSNCIDAIRYALEPVNKKSTTKTRAYNNIKY